MHRTGMLAGAALVLLLSAAAAAGPSRAAPAVAPFPAPCIQSGTVDALAGYVPAPGAVQPPMKEFLGPITDREADQLLRALERVPLDKGKGNGFTVRGVIDRIDLAPTRVRVLLDDVLALLAGIHARDVLKELKSAGGITPKEFGLAEQHVRALTRCLGLRFEERGGAQAFRDSERIVLKRRPQFEKLLLNAEPATDPK